MPESVQRAREKKRLELKESDSRAWLKPVDPGPRTTNKCLGILTSIGVYASVRNLAMKNVAERIGSFFTFVWHSNAGQRGQFQHP